MGFSYTWVMSRHPLPSAAEVAEILGRKRTRAPRRPPPPASWALRDYVKALDKRFGKPHHRLAPHWREIVGETLARHTEPVRLIQPRADKAGGAIREGVLEIRVDGPAAAIVQHQAPDILARVNLVLGHTPVQRLRIVQGPITRREMGPAYSAKRPPLDAAQEAELAASLANVPETPLKAALLKLGRAVLRGR